MKRMVSIAVFMLMVMGFVFSQSVEDYFITKAGTYYTLETKDVVSGNLYISENVSIDQTAKGDFPGETLVMYRTVSSYAKTSTVYSVTKDRVGIVLEQDAFGKKTSYQPYPVVFKLNGNWKERSADQSELYEYKAETGSCAVGGKAYQDCIVITKKIYLSGKEYGTEVSYYAKGIGCVFQKRIDKMGNTSNIQTFMINYIIGSR
jgi:hypothetical protein